MNDAADTRPVSVWIWLAFAVAVCLLDQLTKFFASTMLTFAEPLSVMPLFNLTLLHNTGAAFNFLDSASGWQRWFFAVLAALISVGIIIWLCMMDRRNRWTPFALALILGGAIGNLVDRVCLGYVVDFIQLYYGRWSWPAFNVADSAISIGAVMLIIRAPISADKPMERAG